MLGPSRISHRITLAILLTAVIPLIGAVFIARSLVNNLSAQLYNPRVGQELERSLGLYKELAKSLKTGMRYEAEAIAAREPLRAAAVLRHKPSLQQELDQVFPRYRNLVSLSVVSPDGDVLLTKKRQRPVDKDKELTLDVYRPLGDSDDAPTLHAVFSTPKKTFDQLKNASETVRTYQQIADSLGVVGRGHLYAAMILLLFTIVAAFAVGILLSRGVSRRVDLLSRAARKFGAGDLSVRVPEGGKDEVAELSRAFNAMVREVNQSRARIEFLQRMGTWQEMARRLAHEIKNPLTPIQLAVEELLARYNGEDPTFKTVLQTTTSIIREEVETLRRLVTEFSSFARLPRAQLEATDLTSFMQQEGERLELFDGSQTQGEEHLALPEVDIQWDLPNESLEVFLDKQMMHRVLSNLVRNAAQAVRDEEQELAQVRISVRSLPDDWAEMSVEDNGPGIDDELTETIFDPYVTTKEDGTGLGLSIVKKIIMDHGGSIEAGTSEWGGAKMTIRLPLSRNPASVAARQQEPESSADSRRSWVLAKR